MILVCGEALVDLFLCDSSISGMTAKPVLGGSPYNVAICLARLNESVGFCGGISSDTFGLALRRKLSRENVDLSFVVDSDRLTTISVIATDESGQPVYDFHGEGKADREVTFSQIPELHDGISALTFGSYTLAVEPVASAYLALAERAASTCVISLDPNIRLTVTPDMAHWRQKFDAFLSLADIVKASDEDIAIGYGPDADVEKLMAAWFDAGPSLILVTHGSEGASGYLRSGHKVFIPSHSVSVRDTVGAGDTFHAAILHYLNKSQRLTKSCISSLSVAELDQAMRYATVASAITCTRQGADLPTEREILTRMQLEIL